MDKREQAELWTLCQIEAKAMTMAQCERLIDLAALAVCELRENRSALEALAQAIRECDK